jgi:hypothetical protein
MSDRDKKLLVAGAVILVLAVVIFAVRGTGGSKSAPLPAVAKRSAPPKPAAQAASDQEQPRSRSAARRARSGTARRAAADRLGDEGEQVAAEDQDAQENASEAKAKPRSRGRRRGGGEDASRRSRRNRVEDDSAPKEEKKKEQRKRAPMGAVDA